jgi:hypothetical protein
MDSGLIAGIVVTAINIVGWGYTKVYSLGKLDGRIKNVEDTTARHEKVLNEDGLLQKIGECKNDIGSLKSKVDTYIELTRDSRRSGG